MIKILGDIDFQANINGIIREGYGLIIKTNCQDDSICNQWVDYIGVVIFKSK